jgi:hypothetical protein
MPVHTLYLLRVIETQAPPSPRRSRAGLALGIVLLVFAVLGGLITVIIQADAGARAKQARRIPASHSPLVVEHIAQAMAGKRAKALLAGDEQGWLADLDPAAGDLIAAEKQRFANLRQLAPPVFSLDASYFDPSRHPNALFVEQVMQLSSDVRPTRNTFEWTFRVAGDRVLITTAQAFPDYGGLLRSYADSGASRNVPWDSVALRSATAAHVTVLAPVGGRWDPQMYLPAAVRAAALVRSLWKDRPAAPGFSVFLADDQQFATWFASGEKDKNTVGYAIFGQMVEADGQRRLARPGIPLPRCGQPQWRERAAGARIVLRMSEIASPADAEPIMAHEMAHAIGPYLFQNFATEDAFTDQPTWVLEGFARWVEHQAEPGSAARGRASVQRNRSRYAPTGDHDLPPNAGFYSADYKRTNFNYEISAAIFGAIEQVGGTQKAVDVYITLTNAGSSLTDTRPFLDGQIDECGVDSKEVWALMP